MSWISKRITSISLSTMESKYIAAATCCTQVEWIKQTLQDIKVVFEESTIIYCDNTCDISLSKNLVHHSKAKNIPIKYHYLRDQEQTKR